MYIYICISDINNIYNIYKYYIILYIHIFIFSKL